MDVPTHPGYRRRGRTIVPAGDAVVRLLDLRKRTDAERLVLLAEALTILQTGDREAMEGFTMRLAGTLWKRPPQGGNTRGSGKGQ